MTVRRLRPRARRIVLDGGPSGGRLKLGQIVRAATVELDSGLDGEGPKWQHVATVGVFKGYGGGKAPFAFTEETFGAIVRNFRSHPLFVAGPDGVGANGIVQWDFHHASESPPGEVAVEGAPAQGWVMDLRVQRGTKGAELWALTEWLEPAKSYIKEKKYKWSSVAVALNAIDSVTAEEVGPVLTSIAITNSPFIEGMAELAADKAAAGAKGGKDGENVRLAYAAYSLDEARDCVRRELGLPITATTKDIAAQLQILVGLMAGGAELAAETGVDAEKVVSSLRTILGLPLLTSPDETLRQALSLFPEPAEKPPGDGEAVPGSTTASKPAAAAAVPNGETMDPAMLAALAKKLGVRETPEAVQCAVDGLVDIRSSLVGSLALDRNASDARVADAVKDIAKETGRRRKLTSAIALVVTLAAGASMKKGKLRLEALESESGDDELEEDVPKGDDGDPMKHPLIQKLRGLMEAGGVSDCDKAVAQIVKTLGDAAKLEELEPELEDLRKYSKARKAEEEAEAVAATLRNYYGDDETHKDAVVALYKSIGRKKFLEKYPALGEDADALRATVAAENTHPTRTAARTAPEGETPAAPAAPARVNATRRDAPPPGVVDIAMYPGANDSEKAINALKATVQGADKWDYDTLCATAFDARRTGKFINLSAPSGR